MEIWDAYKKDGTLAGFDLIRGEKIPEGYYHLVCEVLVKHRDGSYLLMQRSYEKNTYPGFYEASAGGSALKGEDKFACIKRELKEETGINENNFIEVGRKVIDKSRTIYHSFICVTDCPKDSIKFQKGETINYKWATKEEFIEFLKSDKVIENQITRIKHYLETLNIGNKYNVIIDREIGSTHPNHKDIIYQVNYGYIPNLIAEDNEEQDAYILGVDKPIKEFNGILIGVIIRLDDNETKWIIAKDNNFSDKDILEKINFQEKYFNSVLIR